MKTLLLIYLASVLFSWLSVRYHERKLGARKGALWPISLVPGFNTIVSIWYLLEAGNRLGKRVCRVLKRKG